MFASEWKQLAMKDSSEFIFTRFAVHPTIWMDIKRQSAIAPLIARNGSSELETLLDDGESHYSRIFQWYSRTLRMRAGCPAFHPDAPQEIMQMGDPIFALRRDSLDGALSVICLFNFRGGGNQDRGDGSSEGNFPANKARDLISGGEIDWSESSDGLVLRPYQALWLSSS